MRESAVSWLKRALGKIWLNGNRDAPWPSVVCLEVDVSTYAWTVNYADAIVTALKITIEGVEVPYVDLQTLIKTKLRSEHRTKWTSNDCVR